MGNMKRSTGHEEAKRLSESQPCGDEGLTLGRDGIRSCAHGKGRRPAPGGDTIPASSLCFVFSFLFCHAYLELGVPTRMPSHYNSQFVLDAVKKRFPDWAAQCDRTYVLTLGPEPARLPGEEG